MKIYANIDSDKSISFLKNYDAELVKIEMSDKTKSMLSTLENSTIANWLMSHNIDTASLGDGIICGITK